MNEYDGLIQDEKQSALRQSLYAVGNTQPDTEAKLQGLATRTGLPLDAVRLRQPEIELHDRLNSFDYTKTVQDAPKLANWMANPKNASIAHDDVENLTAVERAIRSLGGAAVGTARYITSADGNGGFLRDMGAGVQRANRGAAGVFQAAAEVVAPVFDPLAGTVLPENPLRRVAQGFADMGARSEGIAKRMSPASGNVFADGVSSGVQSLTSNLLTLPMALLPGGAGAAMTAMVGSQGGQSYQDAREKGLTAIQALPYAASQAAIEYATEKLPLAKLLGDLKAGSSFAKTLTNNVAREIPGEQVATILQDLNEWAVLKPNAPFSEYIAERPSAAAQTLIATVIGAGGQVTVMRAIQNAFSESGRAEDKQTRAESSANAADELSKLVTASKLNARSSDEFMQFVQEVSTEDGTPKELFVDGEQLLNTLNQSGITMEQLAMVAPTIAGQLRADTFVPGSDIRVPVSEFMAADPSLTAPLIDYMRDGPDAMNRIEAKEFLTTQGPEIQAAVEREISKQDATRATDASVAEVQTFFEGQLNAVGTFRPEVNSAYANMLGNFYATQAARAGMTPMELMDKYRLRVSDKTGGGQMLEQGGAVDTPAFKNWFGDSKVVDAEGRAKPVYRGQQTGTGRNAFTFYSDNAAVANTYTTNRGAVAYEVIHSEGDKHSFDTKIEARAYVAGNGGILTKLNNAPTMSKDFLSLQNPLVIDAQGAQWNQLKNPFARPEQIAAYNKALGAVKKDTKVNGRLYSVDEQKADITGQYSFQLFTDSNRLAQLAKNQGHDGLIIENVYDVGVSMEADEAMQSSVYVAFDPTQIKSAIGNNGNFDPANPNIVEQDARATLSFANDITQAPSVIALLEGANLSSFLHETGHFFLEVQADLASRIQARILAGEEVSAGEQGIVDDMNIVLKSFGIEATPEFSAIQEWTMRTLEERRDAHETFARSFERFAMEGNAPSLEMQGIFSKFRSWLLSVYKSLTDLNVNLSDDVRGVMGRMLASDQAIQEASDARGMGPLYETPEQAGMTPEEFARYQALGEAATSRAATELDTRLLKDMKWLSRARSKAIKAAQADADGLRREVEREVRDDVMAQPVYQAWQILRGRGLDATDVFKPGKAKGRAKTLDPAVDNLFEAIAKLGGMDRDAVKAQWGVEDRLESGVFGSPVLRKSGGTGIDSMAEYLIENGYLLPDAEGKADIAKFEELFDDQRRGVDRFSLSKEYSQSQEDAPIESVDLTQRYAKLNTTELKRRYGEKADAVWRTLSERGMTNNEGMDPDILAESIPGGGFDSGDQLVRELAAARPPSEVIQEQTDQRMLEKYGDITSADALQDAADVAVHNELRARVIASELKALEKAGKVKESGDSLLTRSSIDVLTKAANEYAEVIIARQQIKNLRPKQYAAAEARSAKLALKALGNTAEAAKHKRNQLINNLAAKKAYDAQEEVKKGMVFFRKVITGNQDTVAKTRDYDVVQAARSVLAGYGIGTKGEAAQKYVESVTRNDPSMGAVLRDKIDALSANVKPINDLTVEEFRGLMEEIKGMWYMAKRSRQIEIDGKLVDIESAKIPLVTRLEEIGIPDRVPGEGSAVTDSERRLSKLQTLRAALRRVESWVGAKDGGGIGPFRRFIWQPVKEAADKYRADKAKYLKRYRDLLQNLDVGKGLIDAPELGYVFGKSRGGSGKAELLHAILHTGNESNKRKMLMGREWANDVESGMDTSRWDKFVRRMIETGVLTKQDFDFAQGVWDMLEDMKPLAQKTHRDVFGRYFDEVTADSFTNQFGTYRGGYVPAMMDSEVVKDAATRALQEDENQTMAYSFPSTNKGFTKGRVEINRPLLLDLRSLSQHMDKVLLFSHMEGPIRDVRKILTSKQVSEPLHRVDPSAFDGLLTPWMNRAARQVVETKVPGDNGLMRFFSIARRNAGMAAMFANLSNTVQQVTGLSIAAVKVGPKYLIGGAGQYIFAPRQTAQAVATASAYMASRMENEVSQMSGQIDDILLNPSVYESAQAWTMKHAYFMQSAVDNVIGPIVWTGAYNQAIEQGQTQADAIRLADSAVRETQGSTLPEDVSRFETGNPAIRLFTQFAGYFNMQANLLGTEFANNQHKMGLRKGMGRGLYIFTLGFLIPAMVSEVIVQAFRGGPDDEDKDGEYLDDWLMAVVVMGNVRAALGMVPLLGPTVNAGINTFNRKPYDDRISTSPAISMVESTVSAPNSVYKAVVEDGDKRKAVRDVATLISMTTGLPAAAIARPVGYLIGVNDDRITPTGGMDAVRGVVTGVPSPESKN